MVPIRPKVRVERAPVSKLSSPVLVAGAYLLGPLSLVYLRRGANAIPWAIVGTSSFATVALLAWRQTQLLGALQEGDLLTLFVLGMTAVALTGAVGAWARAVLLAGREIAPRRERFPDWIRNPWTAGALGAFVPGLGLLMSGRPRRAAWAVVWTGALAASLLVLTHAEWLWTWWMGSFGIEGTGIELELGFLAAGAVAAAAGIAWLVQTLDGMRLANPEPEPSARGDLFALALLAALAVFPAGFRPATLAFDLSDLAVALRLEGLRVIPLTFALGAHRLDPSRPLYALRAADLYEDLGWWDEAIALRAGVEERWAVTAPELRHLARTRGTASATGEIPYPTLPTAGESLGGSAGGAGDPDAIESAP